MRKKICILEDDIDLLQLLEINCKLRGYDEVYTETDGLRGFNLMVILNWLLNYNYNFLISFNSQNLEKYP